MFRFLPLISVKDITSAIFDAVVTPVTNAVGKVISTVLNTIINDVLMPILEPFFKSLVEPILGIIGDLFMAWIHIRTYYGINAYYKEMGKKAPISYLMYFLQTQVFQKYFGQLPYWHSPYHLYSELSLL